MATRCELTLAATLGVAALLCAVASAAEYYVDVDSRGGPAVDTGPGSREKPWRTLVRATADKQPRPGAGDTVWVRGGVYKAQVRFLTGGAEGRPLTVKAFADEKPVIDGQGKRSSGIVFAEEGSADYVVLRGLTLRNFREGGTGVSIQRRTGVTVRDCDVSGARIGVWIGRSSDCRLLNSEVHHCQDGNVLVDTGCTDIVVADCHLHHNKARHCLSVYAPGNGVRGEAQVESIVGHAPGIAKMTVTGLDLSKVRHGTLRGQDENGTVDSPSLVLLFPDANPKPNGKPLPGGNVRMTDGRDWFVLRANPKWSGKPYSPDGKSCLLELGGADLASLTKAKCAYVAYRFNDDVANRDIRLLRNEVDHSAVQGIWVQRAEGVLIQDNETHHNGATGIQIESLCRRIWLVGNTSYANCQRYSHETGLWLDETIDAVVQGNTVYENQKGMGATQCQWTVFRNNLIYNNQAQHVTRDARGCQGNAGAFWFSGGRHSHLGAPPGATHNAFVHNTLYANGTELSSWGGIQHGISGYPAIGRNYVLSNLVQDNLGKHPVFVGCTEAVLDGNLYWGPTPFRALWGLGEAQATYDLSDRAGWDDYRRTTRQDSRSQMKQVDFVDPENGDFHLKPGSPAIDAGCALTRTARAGSGKDVPVEEVCFFTAGLKTRNGETVVPGDQIMIGGAPAQVVSIDREASVLTVNQTASWNEGDPVTYRCRGAGPDAGAIEAD